MKHRPDIIIITDQTSVLQQHTNVIPLDPVCMISQHKQIAVQVCCASTPGIDCPQATTHKTFVTLLHELLK
jgi:hypothetical protein